jgi:hypothetical protein
MDNLVTLSRGTKTPDPQVDVLGAFPEGFHHQRRKPWVCDTVCVYV